MMCSTKLEKPLKCHAWQMARLDPRKSVIDCKKCNCICWVGWLILAKQARIMQGQEIMAGNLVTLTSGCCRRMFCVD